MVSDRFVLLEDTELNVESSTLNTPLANQAFRLKNGHGLIALQFWFTPAVGVCAGMGYCSHGIAGDDW